MANAWFRMYSEFADDPKVQMMPEAMQRRLTMLFCLRCKEMGLGDTEVAFALRISEQDVEATKKLFIEKGFIDTAWNIQNWDDRQFISDSSAERTRRYRDKRETAGLKRGSNHLSDPQLYERDGRKCVYCDGHTKLCIDHIFPITLGGDDHPDNLAVACKACNSGKAGRTPEQAGLIFNNLSARDRHLRYMKMRDGHSDAPRTEQNRTDTEQIQKHKKPLALTSFEVRADEPHVGAILLVDKTYFKFTQSDVDDWQEAYPGVGVMQQLREMREWAKANATKRVTPKGIRRFITSWLAREQDKFAQKGPTNVRKSITQQNIEDLQDIARRLDEADGGGDGMVSESEDRQANPNALPERVEGHRRPALLAAV